MDSFEKYDRKQSKNRFKEFYTHIEDAREYHGNSDFIDSCEEFLVRNKFLTEKQIKALQNLDSRYLEDGVSWYDQF